MDLQTQQVGARIRVIGAAPDGPAGDGRERPSPSTVARGGPAMTRLRSALATARSSRARRRDERELQRALAAAPTQESRHEIAAMATRF